MADFTLMQTLQKMVGDKNYQRIIMGEYPEISEAIKDLNKNDWGQYDMGRCKIEALLKEKGLIA